MGSVVIDPYVTDWLNLLVRWFHILVGAAWIGTSLYFKWLNNSLRHDEDMPEDVGGEVWSVHGGGFYQVRKYKVAPKMMLGMLHWFEWEACLTWVSGICLVGLVYYLGADVYLTDPSVAQLTSGQALGLGSLVLGWFIYDGLCKTSALFAGVALTLGALEAFGYSEVFSARGAYIQMGALLGTCMAANVFFVIIPGQRAMVTAMNTGFAPDPEKGNAGALRSLHNNYMTLPVLFIMVSNYYPMTYGTIP